MQYIGPLNLGFVTQLLARRISKTSERLKSSKNGNPFTWIAVLLMVRLKGLEPTR